MSDAGVEPSPASNRDLVPLAVLALALLAFLLAPFVLDGFEFPLGPDAPVYLWWTRIAGLDGISAAGDRPGAPALLVELAGTTGLPLTALVAAVEVAFGASIGVLSATLVRARSASRPTWLLAGALAGVFSVHLVAGYIANLLFVVGFLAAAVALAERTRRGSWAAAALLGATGLAHPYFFLVGVAVLIATAVLARREAAGGDAEPGEAGRIMTAVLGAVLLVGAGLLSMLWGARPPDVETSRDGLLRRVGLGAELASAYRERFVDRWARYVQWASLPLAAIGIGFARGFVARLLLAWSAVTVVGVIVGLAFAWYPPDRFVTFGFAIPILAGLGIARAVAWTRGRWRPLSYAVASLLIVAMVLGASFAWFRNQPYITADEVHAVRQGAAIIDRDVGEAVFSFIVEEPGADAPTFLLARAWNVALASVPDELIRDVVPLLPPTGAQPSEERTRVAALMERIRDERLRSLGAPTDPDEAADAGRYVEVVLPPFAKGVLSDSEHEVLVLKPAPPGLAPFLPRDVQALPAPNPLPTVSPFGIALASILVLAVLGIVGFGWASVSVASTVTRIVLAPASGTAALIIAALVVDRIGIRIDGIVPPIVALLTAAGGYAVLLLQWRAGTQPPIQVEEHPH